MEKQSTVREVSSKENVVIRSQRYNTGKILGILVLSALLVALLVVGILSYNLCDYELEWYKEEMNAPACSASKTAEHTCSYSKYNSALGFLLAEMVDACFHFSYHLIGLGIFGGLSLISVICYFGLKSYELVVTDKRIYGAISFGKRVDLPMDSVSAVAVIPLSKGISVSTSSGSISFRYIKNAEEIHECINQLLIARQQTQTEEKRTSSTENTVAVAQDKYDELKKLKDLLDMGVITPEEFDAKKKQLLGL